MPDTGKDRMSIYENGLTQHSCGKAGDGVKPGKAHVMIKPQAEQRTDSCFLAASARASPADTVDTA